MNAEAYGEEGLFIQSDNIFEWSQGEKDILKEKTEYGFDAVISLLNAIGYYATRSKKKEELNPFETLVGGLSWCIGYIKPEFNRNIAYTEGMSLGKKIAISESIIVCLHQMNYPECIWPQQIQGMDYKAMIGVLSWLKDRILSIRNSIPVYEALSAEHAFEESIRFEEEDKPSARYINRWYSQTSSSFPDQLEEFGSVGISSSFLLPCSPREIVSYYSFMASRAYATAKSYDDNKLENYTDELLDAETVQNSFSSLSRETMESEERPMSLLDETRDVSIVRLMKIRKEKVEKIKKEKNKEERRMKQLNECKKKYIYLQEYYRQAEATIQSLASKENNEETVAKLQELKSLLQLMQSLNFQRNTNLKTYEDTILSLREQQETRLQAIEKDRNQFSMIVQISENVESSLQSLLHMYRSINTDILKCQCYLEQIPSKIELLFYEKEIAQFLESISRYSSDLCQVHDLRIALLDCKQTYQNQSALLLSLLSALRSEKDSKEVSESINDQIIEVNQKLTKLIQLYNVELKKRTRLLKTTTDNQTIMLEKKRLYTKVMQLLHTECERNVKLNAKLRELQQQNAF